MILKAEEADFASLPLDMQAWLWVRADHFPVAVALPVAICVLIILWKALSESTWVRVGCMTAFGLVVTSLCVSAAVFVFGHDQSGIYSYPLLPYFLLLRAGWQLQDGYWKMTLDPWSMFVITFANVFAVDLAGGWLLEFDLVSVGGGGLRDALLIQPLLVLLTTAAMTLTCKWQLKSRLSKTV